MTIYQGRNSNPVEQWVEVQETSSTVYRSRTNHKHLYRSFLHFFLLSLSLYLPQIRGTISPPFVCNVRPSPLSPQVLRLYSSFPVLFPSDTISTTVSLSVDRGLRPSVRSIVSFCELRKVGTHDVSDTRSQGWALRREELTTRVLEEILGSCDTSLTWFL